MCSARFGEARTMSGPLLLHSSTHFLPLSFPFTHFLPLVPFFPLLLPSSLSFSFTRPLTFSPSLACLPALVLVLALMDAHAAPSSPLLLLSSPSFPLFRVACLPELVLTLGEGWMGDAVHRLAAGGARCQDLD
ncbi:hypothetical protein DFH06DRAFT_1225047 [Mycena polygramma]|nr:hypothetical protein DFH06DRAFT_1225047 [Mycena polygramma]